MLALVAWVEVHVIVDDCPSVIVERSEEIVTVGARYTVTTTLSVTVP